MRRYLEDLFQAAAAIAAGLLLLWAGGQLRPAGGLPQALSAGSLADLQTAAALAASAAGLLVLAWWTLGLAAAVCSAVLLRRGKPGAAHAVGRLCPGFMRRLAAAALGLSLAAAPVPALAGSPVFPSAASGSSAPAASTGSNPLWQPERGESEPVSPAWKPSRGPVPGSLLLPPGSRQEDIHQSTVTVVAGDTLWGLAAEQLGPLATDFEVASHWPRWFELNRAVIGPDPDLLLPGQVLAAPPLPAD